MFINLISINFKKSSCIKSQFNLKFILILITIFNAKNVILPNYKFYRFSIIFLK